MFGLLYGYARSFHTAIVGRSVPAERPDHQLKDTELKTPNHINPELNPDSWRFAELGLVTGTHKRVTTSCAQRTESGAGSFVVIVYKV